MVGGLFIFVIGAEFWRGNGEIIYFGRIKGREDIV